MCVCLCELLQREHVYFCTTCSFLVFFFVIYSNEASLALHFKKKKLTAWFSLLTQKKKGTHLGKPGVTYTKAHELVLEPLSDNTCWDFDGERAANATTHISVMHGVATLAC